MTIRMRRYGHPRDFDRASNFLVRHYQPGNRGGNWLQPAWAYMHYHPALDEAALDRIGIWEDGGEIVAIVHYESALGEAFFQLHPDYAQLKPEMLDYAEGQLYGLSRTGRRYVHAYIHSADSSFAALARFRGYERTPQYDRALSRFVIPVPFPEIVVPDGYHLKSLQQDNDLRKVDHVLWRGFDHEGESPPENVEGRKKVQSAPGFRKDLNIVVEAPDGRFVSYAGTWFEVTNRYAYIEPAATDPDYRRRGLGRAAVLEGIRRCAELGATVAYVGSDLAFYLAIGFEKIHTSQCWTRYL
ncbi:MAG: GNAT family N-acetyltransferase [Anaerolineae bacterium]|jgi:predicted N-acetyltransferase YhbS